MHRGGQVTGAGPGVVVMLVIEHWHELIGHAKGICLTPLAHSQFLEPGDCVGDWPQVDPHLLDQLTEQSLEAGFPWLDAPTWEAPVAAVIVTGAPHHKHPALDWGEDDVSRRSLLAIIADSEPGHSVLGDHEVNTHDCSYSGACWPSLAHWLRLPDRWISPSSP